MYTEFRIKAFRAAFLALAIVAVLDIGRQRDLQAYSIMKTWPSTTSQVEY